MSSSSCDDHKVSVKTEPFTRKRRLSSKSMAVKRSEILGFYSMNGDFKFCNDLTQLRYLHLPSSPDVHFDLKFNEERIIRKKCATNDLKLDPLFKWIISHLQECRDEDKRSMGDFVTFRGVLSKIMWTPYENHEGWIICASKFKGTIYLCKYDTPEKIEAEASRSKREKDMGDWGYIFEQFLLSEHPGSPPNTDEPNNQNEEFACVFRTSIGPYNLVFSAEMDGIEIRNQKNMKEIGNDSKILKKMLENGDASFVELKTSADPAVSERVWNNIRRFKSLKWWTQSYLVSINNVFCGYRDNDGIVKRLEKYSVRKLPELGRGFWNPDLCLQYLVDFLKLVVEQVSSGCDEQLWQFTWNPKHPNAIEVELLDHCSPYFFMHKWATEGIELNKQKCKETAYDSKACSSEKK